MQDPFEELQAYWYGKLKESGFTDIEDGKPEPLLKRWTGAPESMIDLATTKCFPEALYSQEEQFMNHSEFRLVCESISRHGNCRTTPDVIAQVWESFFCSAFFFSY